MPIGPLDLPLSEIITKQYTPKSVDFSYLEENLLARCGDNLRYCRVQLGCSQEALAQAMCVSQRQYCNYENGYCNIPMDIAARFMLTTGVPLHYLLVNTGYDKLFNELVIMPDSVNLQGYLGRCDDRGFRWLVFMICDYLEIAPPTIPEDLMGGNNRAKALQDMDNYYAIVADGLMYFRKTIRESSERLASLIGIDSRTWRAYERNQFMHRFSMVMAMRFWIATGVNPLFLTHGSSFFRQRVLQHNRMHFVWNIMSSQKCKTSLVDRFLHVINEVVGPDRSDPMFRKPL